MSWVGSPVYTGLALVLWAFLLLVTIRGTVRLRQSFGYGSGNGLLLLLVFALGLLVRFLSPDAPQDVRLNLFLVQEPFRSDHVMSYHWSPVTVFWHLSAAAADHLLGSTPWETVVFLNRLAGALVALPVFAIVRRMTRSRAAGFIAAFGMATFPPLVRFSGTPTLAVMETLFFAFFVQSFLAASIGSKRRLLVVAAGWFALLSAARPAGVGYAVAGVLFCLPLSWRRGRLSLRTMALLALPLIYLLLPRIMANLALQTSDLAFSEKMKGWDGSSLASVLFSDFVGPAFSALFIVSSLVGLIGRRRIFTLVAVAGIAAVSAAIGFHVKTEPTNMRYYLPLAVLVIPVVVSGLHTGLSEWLRLPGRWFAAAGVVLLALSLAPAWPEVYKRVAVAEEVAFLREQLKELSDDCIVLTRYPEQLGDCFRPGNDTSWGFGKRHEWVYVTDPDRLPAIAPSSCVVSYHGGSCHIEPHGGGPDDTCRQIEAGLRLAPIASSEAGGSQLAADAYDVNPYPVALYRVPSLESGNEE